MEIALKKNAMVTNISSADFAVELAKSIQDNAEKIINQNNSRNISGLFNEEYISGLIKKINEEKKEKLDILEVAFNKKKKLICDLAKKLDELVLGQDIEESENEINTLLDELSATADERQEIYSIIEEIKNS